MTVTPSAVKRLAKSFGLDVRQPGSLRSVEEQHALAETSLDVLVVAAYGLILPRSVLEWPRSGCLNIHASLLPRWRGAAPIVRAIEAGDQTSGISIMQMDAGLDTGPVVSQFPLEIAARETSGSLHDRLAGVGASAIVDVLGRLARDGRLFATAQPESGVTYAAKIGRADAVIDWCSSAEAVDRRIRAMSPSPGAETTFDGAPVKVLVAMRIDGFAEPGVVAAVSHAGVDVGCGSGSSPGSERSLLRLATVKPAGGRAMDASAFAAGRGMRPGSRFGLSTS